MKTNKLRELTPAPFACFSSSRNLNSFLVRSKSYSFERKIGCEKCSGKKCFGHLNVAETNTLKSFQTKKQYKRNHNLKCNDTCLTYLLSCKIFGLQYVDSTITIHFVITGTAIKITTEPLKEGYTICTQIYLNT